MSYSNINEYISDLKKYLNNVSNKEKNSFLNEIEAHLIEKINELKKKNLSDDIATREVLANFENPEKLAQEYINENYDNDPFKNSTSIYLINSGLVGLGFLAISIVRGEFDWASITLGTLLILTFLIVLFTKKIWNPIEIRTLSLNLKIFLFLHVPVSTLLFWIAAKMNNGIVMFSLYYIIIYWFVLSIFALIVKIKLNKIKYE